MPISYELDDRGSVRSRAVGVVSLVEVRAHVERLADDTRLAKPLHELFDGRAITTLTLRGTDVRGIVDLAARFHPAFGKAHVAIVSGPDALFGLGRMAQAFAEVTPFTFRVFRDHDEALAWFESLERPAD